MAGRGWSERAKALGIMAKASPRPGRTVPGTKKSPQVERREALPCALFPGDPGTRPRRVTLRLSALRFPSQKGRQTKSLTSRGGARTQTRGCLKFESELSFPGRDAARSSSRSAASQSRDPYVDDVGAPEWAPAQQRTAPQGLRAALRPGHATQSAPA